MKYMSTVDLKRSLFRIQTVIPYYKFYFTKIIAIIARSIQIHYLNMTIPPKIISIIMALVTFEIVKFFKPNKNELRNYHRRKLFGFCDAILKNTVIFSLRSLDVRAISQNT